MKYSLMIIAALALGSATAFADVIWGRSTQNLIYCFPADSSGKTIPNAAAVDDVLCLRKYGGEWGRGTDGVTRCYPRSTAQVPAPRYPIHASWCAN